MIERLPQDGPGEIEYGYTSAVAAGPFVLASGHASLAADDSAGQARAAFGAAVATMAKAGAKPSDVVRTRIYYTEADDADAIARTHREFFGENPPAATMVRVAGLLLPQFKVEVELEAYRP